ncbi:hypothetical protein AGMMS50225_13540 [Betaproteobacteria bacterium]|nr:hypothetical protein AGMMS50225_13540 [Betaproteobacteria bacterium]
MRAFAMHKLLSGFGVALFFAATPALASVFHFNGNLSYHNEVITIGFTLDQDASDIRLWTDSFQDDLNFDPALALWSGNGDLLGTSDDSPWVNPASQSWGDAGFELGWLAAGDYLLTLTPWDNLALGASLSEGFSFDADTPIDFSVWNAWSGANWSVWLDGVDAASLSGGNSAPVPEPGLLSLLGIGALIGYRSRRRLR